MHIFFVHLSTHRFHHAVLARKCTHKHARIVWEYQVINLCHVSDSDAVVRLSTFSVLKPNLEWHTTRHCLWRVGLTRTLRYPVLLKALGMKCDVSCRSIRTCGKKIFNFKLAHDAAQRSLRCTLQIGLASSLVIWHLRCA